MSRNKTTRSEKIRRYIRENPDAKSGEVAKALGVKPILVYTVKHQAKRAGTPLPSVEKLDVSVARDSTAERLAEMIAEVLRFVAVTKVFALCEKKIVVRRLDDAAAEVTPGRERPVLPVDHPDVVESRRGLVDEPRAKKRGAAAAVHRLGVADVDRAILDEAAVEDDVVQAALTHGEHGRHACDRWRQLAIARGDAQAAGLFGHQHSSVGQERNRPRIGKAADDGFNLEIAAR